MRIGSWCPRCGKVTLTDVAMTTQIRHRLAEGAKTLEARPPEASRETDGHLQDGLGRSRGGRHMVLFWTPVESGPLCQRRGRTERQCPQAERG